MKTFSAHSTGLSDSIVQDPPVKNNEKAKLSDPFALNQWIDEHKEQFSRGQPISLFPDRFQTRVWVFPKGEHTIDCANGDVWLWQHVSSAHGEDHITLSLFVYVARTLHS